MTEISGFRCPGAGHTDFEPEGHGLLIPVLPICCVPLKSQIMLHLFKISTHDEPPNDSAHGVPKLQKWKRWRAFSVTRYYVPAITTSIAVIHKRIIAAGEHVAERQQGGISTYKVLTSLRNVYGW